MRYVEKYGTAGQDADDSIKGRRKMRVACWITKGIIQAHTHNM
jgi:hypothetical protein